MTSPFFRLTYNSYFYRRRERQSNVNLERLVVFAGGFARTTEESILQIENARDAKGRHIFYSTQLQYVSSIANLRSGHGYRERNESL